MTTREDIVANVVHILSSSTRTSPLVCRCERRESVDETVDGGRESRVHFSWDAFVSLSEFVVENNGRVIPVTYSKLIYNWLNDFLPTLHHYGPHTNEEEIINAFVDISKLDNLLKRPNKPTDGELWQAGLQLLRTHLYPDETCDDEDTTFGEVQDKHLDPIPPHILLQTVMHSYYGHDNDLDLGYLSSMGEEGPLEKVTLYYLPTSISIFFLRSLLMAHAIESANESMRVSRAKSQPIRWKRLKSMIDDARALFRLMTFDYAGKAIGNYAHVREPIKVNVFQPVEPSHIISVATWTYTNLLLPCSHSLLGEILKDESFRVGTEHQYRGKMLESCYDTFSMLTTLLALDVSGVVQTYSSPSCCVQWALQCIESKSTSEFFDLVMTETARYNFTSVGVDSGMYLPWIVKRNRFHGRGKTLCDDLLLSPTIRKMNENTYEVSDTTFYDELGIAYMAYWKLMAQAKAISCTIDPLPSPYSGANRWVLLMPQVVTFLMFIKSSSTMAKMEELELISRSENHNLVEICGKLASFGFDFLHTIITETTAVRPTFSSISESSNVVVQYGYSERGLGMIYVALLSHAVRLSHEPPAQAFITRTYSSLDVLNMTRTLIRLHQPAMQNQIIETTYAFIENSDFKVIVPRLIDFLRQPINDMCDNVKQYGDTALAVADMTVMQKISVFLNTSIDGACALAANLHSNDARKFVSSSEKYSAVFALMRLQQIWLKRTNRMASIGEIDDEKVSSQLSAIDEWMKESLRKLESFYQKIHILITIWEKSDTPPDDWHMLYLLQNSLNDLYNNN